MASNDGSTPLTGVLQTVPRTATMANDHDGQLYPLTRVLNLPRQMTTTTTDDNPWQQPMATTHDNPPHLRHVSTLTTPPPPPPLPHRTTTTTVLPLSLGGYERPLWLTTTTPRQPATTICHVSTLTTTTPPLPSATLPCHATHNPPPISVPLFGAQMAISTPGTHLYDNKCAPTTTTPPLRPPHHHPPLPPPFHVTTSRYHHPYQPTHFMHV
ncbi:hypothetical protein BYT27DRAFT_7263644 [Phlegmacium glaucopus]|nr:hypothetical protein BYT27DRAFT_7263644 [Phlegmacium glaucopus]